MSEQGLFLKNQIKFAKDGDPAAESILRVIVKGCADAAPLDDLVRIAGFLLEINCDHYRKAAEEN